MKRRNFIKCTISGMLLAQLGCDAPQSDSRRFYRFGYTKKNYLRPPGSLKEDEFLKACINCGVCGQVCDRNAIRFFREDFEKKTSRTRHTLWRQRQPVIFVWHAPKFARPAL